MIMITYPREGCNKWNYIYFKIYSELNEEKNLPVRFRLHYINVSFNKSWIRNQSLDVCWRFCCAASTYCMTYGLLFADWSRPLTPRMMKSKKIPVDAGPLDSLRSARSFSSIWLVFCQCMCVRVRVGRAFHLQGRVVLLRQLKITNKTEVVCSNQYVNGNSSW